MELETAAERAVLDDPLARLEHGIEDKRRAKETRSRILELRADAELKYADDYAANKALRAKNRSAKPPPGPVGCCFGTITLVSSMLRM